MKKIRLVAVVLLVVLSSLVVGCSEMSDQDQQAYSISGVVEDQAGEKVANSKINYKTAQDSGVVNTNQQGEWQISNLVGTTKLELKDGNSKAKTISEASQDIKLIKDSTFQQNSSFIELGPSVIKESLVKIKEDYLVFEKKEVQVKDISAGEILGIKASDSVPTGLVRKVEKVVTENKHLIVETTKLDNALSKEQTSLEENNKIIAANNKNNLTVLAPQYAEVGEKVTFNGSIDEKSIWAGGIYRIVFKVDGYTLGTAHPSGGKYNFNYKFTHTGQNRELTATGYDVWGNVVDKVSKTITVSQKQPARNLTVDIPSSLKVGKNATFSGTAPRNVNKVILSVDGYKIGTAQVRNGKYSLDYSFYQAGQNRRLVVNAFDRYGRSLKQITKKINVAAENNYQPPENDTAVKLDVPYYYQLNNTYEPYRTCNITSVAMALSYKTINIDPDTIHQRFGPVFTGYDMQRIARHYGATNTTYHAGASVSQIKNYLDRGIPVIFQGQFTSSGHIIVLIGYDDTGWFVHDPYGEWYSWGYQHTPTAGKAEHYSYGLIERESLGAYHVTAVY